MSFFGFEDNDPLQREKQKFLAGKKTEEDLAVYTWGEESYDGLGDALLEGGDELNDETFGSSGAVGRDFDFTQGQQFTEQAPSDPSHSLQHSVSSLETSGSTAAAAPARQPHSLWDEKSPFSVLPRSSNSVRALADHHRSSSSARLSTYSNGSISSAGQARTQSPGMLPTQTITQGVSQTGRTLQEIEAEMRAAAQQTRSAAATAATQRQQLLQEQQAQQAQQQQVQQQQHFYQQQRTAPPRMHPQSQSPRFHQQQQAQQLLQQQQLLREQVLEQQLREQQLREQQVREQQLMREERAARELLREQQLQEQLRRERALQDLQLQEQRRLEEVERQLRAARISELQQQQLLQSQYLHQHQRQASNGSPLSQHMGGRRQQSPALLDAHLQAAYAQNGQVVPQNIQLQQRLLSELAQVEFISNIHASPEEQEALRAEAMRRIMETERMEEKRRRKAAKIAHMARYNDLMTQSDKDFITRIQVSQLVTQDPYADDFYAQVYGAILRSRLGLQASDERVLKFGSGGGVGLGLGQKSAGRRPNAMQKMEQQVERIVNNARLREHDKAPHSLQGALGKTSGRSYKAAPRQLLQVDTNGATSPTTSHPHISKEDAIRMDREGAAKEAAKMGAEALGVSDPEETVRRDPLTSKETLAILEKLYDLVLNIEQLRREQPPSDSEDFEAVGIWNARLNESIHQLWDGLRVMVPLETSNPHPFISLITPTKGKKLLPRVSRHLSSQQMLTMLTLLVACFSQMDIVIDAPLLDAPHESPAQAELERQTQAFLGSVVQSILPVVAKAGLRLVSGLLGLLMERSDIVAITQTRPGLAVLTLFLSRVELIKQSMSSATDLSELPSQEETEQWELMFDHLFQLLHPNLLFLFPSTRIGASLSALPPDAPPVAALHTDALDQPVWQFLAALALHSSNEQQQALVTALRGKVLENVASANKGWVASEDERLAKLGNVNLFLHALGLDSSQISV
ncbi:hypothetical protein FA95DRAFT_1680073 [Auriscalpium vulgare]|uniref:Uncharacterized protein n=1 Tax=Auriscalpium vulgare TaxID=40419 RepID=A0ACB8RPI9_9AGAM|nr:hypothetical protein FA95DRAFT_1680073 [Auriscalpium vulgare]